LGKGKTLFAGGPGRPAGKIVRVLRSRRVGKAKSCASHFFFFSFSFSSSALVASR
jgi:hypothetical protein